MLAAILSVEALEDNEALIVEGVRHVSRINDPRNRATFEALTKPNTVSNDSLYSFDHCRRPKAVRKLALVTLQALNIATQLLPSS